MKRKKAIAIVVNLFLCVSLLAGCGSSGNESPSGEASKSPENTPAPTSDTIVLKYADFQPDGIPTTDYFEEACNAIYERTEGRVKIDCYFSSTLLTFPEIATGTASGIADLAYYMTGTAAGVFTLGEFSNLPILRFKSQEQAAKIYSQLYEEFPALTEEAEAYGITPVVISPLTPFQLHMVTDEVIKLPSELIGKSIVADGRVAVGIANLGNVDAMTLSSDQFYSTLQKGVADGQITHNLILSDFALSELTKTHTFIKDSGFAMCTFQLIANTESWNKVSAADQAIIIEELENYAARIRARDMEAAAEVIAQMEKEQTVYYLTDEEVDVWEEEVGVPTANDWITECEDLGLPGQELYDRLQELIAED